MEVFDFTYPGDTVIDGRVHVGVVGSGDLEILLEPSPDDKTHVRIRTSVEGYGAVWQSVLDRFFSRYHGKVAIEINDFGATPGMVSLRLQQAVEESGK
jgi:malonate decarboxylase delta subunit